MADTVSMEDVSQIGQAATDEQREIFLRTLGIAADCAVPQSLVGAEDSVEIASAVLTTTTSFASQTDVVQSLENVLQQLLPAIETAESGEGTSMEVDIQRIGAIFQIAFLDDVVQSTGYKIIHYLLGSLDRIERFLGRTPVGEAKKFGERLRNALYEYFTVCLRGYLPFELPMSQINFAVLRLLLIDEFPISRLYRLIDMGVAGSGVDDDFLSEIFNPILDSLRLCASTASLVEQNDMIMEKPFHILAGLLSYKTPTNRRPICDLITARPDFLPKLYTGHRGRELAKLSFLGPFYAIGVADMYSEVLSYRGVSKYFDAHEMVGAETNQRIYDIYQSRMNSYRRLMFGITHPLLVNASTRDTTLSFLALLLKTNKKRAQIQADAQKLATDAFMMNLMSVMIELSSKITLDKVTPTYIFHPKCRIDVRDETRLHASSDDVAEFEKTIDVTYDPKFATECFFLTIHSIHLGFNATIEVFKYVRRHYQHLANSLKAAEAELQRVKQANDPRAPFFEEKIKKMKKAFVRVVRAYMCLECTIRDRQLLERTVQFSMKQLDFLISLINPNFDHDFVIPPEAPKIFSMYPELYLEAVLEFVVYLVQAAPQILLTMQQSFKLPEQLLIFLCSTHYLHNPFLAAKVIDMVFTICPEINPPLAPLHSALVSSPVATQRLVPSLIKFYSDLETGADFYEKFNIRRNMQVIFRSLWDMPIYRAKICEIARQCEDEFIRFVNMVINDATFLLDESLANLKKIHDVEVRKDNATLWNALNEEDRQREESSLEEAQRSVKSWLIMGDDTMDMFGYLTRDVPQPFYKDPLGDRVASMLNHNLLQLCGPNCTELKVRDALSRFHWNPRRLLEQIVEVYLNLFSDSDEFALCIASDERSYTPGRFQMALDRINKVLSISYGERFKNLVAVALQKYNEKAQMEEDFGDDIPEAYCDPLLATVMRDPVRLPSGNVVDRKNIHRHLLSSPIDPFSRLPCTPEDLIPVPELKAEIEAWILQRRTNAQGERDATAAAATAMEHANAN